VFGVNFKSLPKKQINFQRAWDILTPSSKEFIERSILEGLNLFKKQFGFSSKTVIAPNYTWTLEQEKLLFSEGVKYMQGMLRQRISVNHDLPYKYTKRFSKRVSKNSIGYLRRNVFFEPSQTKSNYSTDKALSRIDMAFRVSKPAVIGTHRVNFIGVHDKKNRDKNLILLKDLLKNIVKKWPDVIFLSSDEILNYGEIH
jgi:hypothetical protein